MIDVKLPAYAGPFLRPARFKSLSGGRDSAKSHTTAQIMLLRMAGMLPDYERRPVRIVSCRDFGVNLKNSRPRSPSTTTRRSCFRAANSSLC